MAATAVVGLTTGHRLLSTSIYSSDHSDKLLSIPEHGSSQLPAILTRKVIVAKKNDNFSPKTPNRPSKKEKQAIRALKEHTTPTPTTTMTTTTTTMYAPTIGRNWFDRANIQEDIDTPDVESSLEAFILLQKAMLEKQWSLSFDNTQESSPLDESNRKIEIIRSGLTARKRRNATRRKCLPHNSPDLLLSRRKLVVSPDLLNNRFNGYVQGNVCKYNTSHAEVVQLSKKIRAGLSIEEHKKRLSIKLGREPSNQQLAASLRMSCVELKSNLIECSLARQKLAMSNVRLVIAIAQKYNNMGVDLADLIQGGLLGLLRGIEKFDSSKGYRISTYVYWWIRQGVSRAFAKNCRVLQLPFHIHERLYLIRTAKAKLEKSGVTPTNAKIAEVLNMSERKVRNAAEAPRKVVSLDREVFPSLNGRPGETFHSYVADPHLENNPWQVYEKLSVKNEVDNLLNTTLREREKEIIRLYHGLDGECQSWEEISHLVGVSRERVRQVGLVAMQKLKHAGRSKNLDAMLVKH